MTVELGTYRLRVGLFCFFQSRAKGCGYLTHFELCCWLAIMLILSGDIHENPGPDSSCNSSTSSFVPAEGNLSIIHYNVQSFFNKRDILYRDLRNYDVLSFTETWLDANTHNHQSFPLFHSPLRRDRHNDAHGGILVFVKSDIFVVERGDFEVNDIECLWLELRIKGRSILVGTFYRPPILAQWF